MREPTLLLQSGQVMAAEKTACAFSNYLIEYCKYGDLHTKAEGLLKYVPVGSVEFTEAYCNVVGITVPTPLAYPDFTLPYLHREVKISEFGKVSPDKFIKPYSKVKLFTGCLKKDLAEQGVQVHAEEKVWEFDNVPFESEFRFYIHDFVTGPKIQGWSRYDDLPMVNPEPDIELVEQIAKEFHDSIGPNAYTIDIGWRSDIGCYSLIEVNDGWALGYYSPNDSQSNPPTRQQYADMLVSRWMQIVFCAVLDKHPTTLT